jgi:outer membrane protein OmpA-like peptidoglycan-associated protein
MKNIIALCIFIVQAFYANGQSVDTFEVYFAKNVTRLSAEATTTINRLINTKALMRGQKLMMLGYTDYVGNVEYNNALSETRAKSVRNYLITKGFEEQDLKVCLGKGKIERANVAGKEGVPHDRKVQIIIEHNLAPAAAANPPLTRDNIAKVAVKNAPLSTTISQGATPMALMDLSTIKVNQTVALNNIFFEGGTSNILPTSKPELEKLYGFLKDNQGITIRIEGHVCCMGPVQKLDSANYSGARAKAVFDYLVSKGINKDRMKYVGRGNFNPVVKEEKTEADRELNRRVEIRILSK